MTEPGASRRSSTDIAIRAEAERLGIEVRWEDTQHRMHDVAPEVLRSLVAVLRDDDRPPAVDPVATVAPGGSCVLEVRGRVGETRFLLDPRSVGTAPTVDVGQVRGRRSQVTLSGPIPIGRHQLEMDVDGTAHTVTVLAPPVTTPRTQQRSIAVFAPCYSLRSAGGHGVGDLGDLDHLAAALHPMGVQIVSTLPLYATFTSPGVAGGPFDPSPYAPVSRRHWNELYADLADLPGPDGASALSHAGAGRLAAVRAGAVVDWRAVADVVHDTLDRALAVPSVQAQMVAVAAEDADLLAYAGFRVHVERHGTPPSPGQAIVTDVGDPAVRRHVLGQILMRRQLAELRDGWSRRGQALALDLPVGSHGAGYEVWQHAGEFGLGAAVGAPPDDFFVEGQCWGFPPLHPTRSRATGHQVWHEVVDAAATQAGILRIDHVMAVHRLWWIPDGGGAQDGAYVHYRADELWAMLAITAHLRGCTIVGEDLGTVPDEVASQRRRRNVMGMYEEQFTIDQDDLAELPPIPDDVVAGIRTHDMMPFRAFCTGSDTELRERLGVSAPEGSDAATRSARLDRWRALAATELGHPVGENPEDVFTAVVERLGRSAAPVVSVDLDDMLGEEMPHNVPGVPQYEGAWARRLPIDVDEAVSDGLLQSTLSSLRRWRSAATPGPS